MMQGVKDKPKQAGSDGASFRVRDVLLVERL
jgi:hypothetical protein